MSALDSAIAELEDEIREFVPGTTRAPVAGSSGHFKLRALAVGLAYLHRVKALGIDTDLASTERLYRAGSSHFGKALVPDAISPPIETLSPADEAKVTSALSSGNLQ